MSGPGKMKRLVLASPLPARSRSSRANLPFAKLIEHDRASRKPGRRFAALIDAPLVEVPEEPARGLEVGKLRRVEAEHAGARGIRGDQIAAHREHAEAARRAHDWPVAFHADDAVDDREARPDRRHEIDDGIVDAVRCSTFFGQPYTAPGTTPNRFFIAQVMPAQWWVFSFGIDTTRSALSTDAGSAIRPMPLKLLASSRHSTSSVLRSTKRMRCSRR